MEQALDFEKIKREATFQRDALTRSLPVFVPPGPKEQRELVPWTMQTLEQSAERRHNTHPPLYVIPTSHIDQVRSNDWASPGFGTNASTATAPWIRFAASVTANPGSDILHPAVGKYIETAKATAEVWHQAHRHCINKMTEPRASTEHPIYGGQIQLLPMIAPTLIIGSGLFQTIKNREQIPFVGPER